MPSYTSPLARSLGWNLREGYSDTFHKRQIHKIERQHAKEELAFLTQEEILAAEAEATYAITLAKVEADNAWIEAYCEDHADAFQVVEDEAFEAYALALELDDEDDIPADAWGSTFDPEDVQWGFTVRTRF